MKNSCDTKFKIVGGGPLYPVLTNFVKTNNLESYVELLGQRDRRRTMDLMKKCGVILFISKNENYGSLALLESMALGCPVIATDVGSTKDLIINGINGLLVNPDSASIARGIIYLLQNHQIRES